ncbi:hypothetical protein QFC19_002503 [Naganishia cerealis]|uniref:Uncharacterized protein n=1 Tax=Naganishia cerealis TaxID=610337 RepID=A0ACC2WAW6_9TREE|nr:hypothetical protein QFC19_002503 [Naganishia cerealis]
MQLKLGQRLAVVGALILFTVTYSCFRLSSTLPGQGYLSPTTILPSYASSSGLSRCVDAHLVGLTELHDPAHDRVAKERIIEYMQDHITRKQKDFDAQADKEYLGIAIGPTWNLPAYRSELLETYRTYLSAESSAPAEYLELINSRLSLRPSASPYPDRPKQILTSNKDAVLPWHFQRWRSLHRGWKLRKFDDDGLDAWVADNFGGTRAEELWRLLPRPVLKTDIFRYMVMMLEGGIYTDSDTAPVIPADQWGMPYENASDPVLSHLSRILTMPEKTSFPDVEDEHGLPSLVVSVETDAIDAGLYDWKEEGLIRALQIVQWTIMVPLFLSTSGQETRPADLLQPSSRLDRGIPYSSTRLEERFARLKNSQYATFASFKSELPLSSPLIKRPRMDRPGDIHRLRVPVLAHAVRVSSAGTPAPRTPPPDRGRAVRACPYIIPSPPLPLLTLPPNSGRILPAGSHMSISPWEPREKWAPYAAVWHGFWGRWRATDSSDLQREMLNRTKEALQQQG